MAHILKWIKEEIRSVIPAIIYFAITFNLIHFATEIMLQPDDVRYSTYLSVTIDAIIMGKVLIIVRAMPFINVFPKQPLIYNIIWKLFIYNIFIIFLRLCEHFLHLLFRHENLSTIWQILYAQITSHLFLSTQIWLFLTLLGFITFNEFGRLLGADKLKKMLFG